LARAARHIPVFSIPTSGQPSSEFDFSGFNLFRKDQYVVNDKNEVEWHFTGMLKNHLSVACMPCKELHSMQFKNW